MLADGLHHRAVAAHGLDAVDHLSEGNDHAIIEFTLAEVNRLPEPNELQDERAENGQQTCQDEQSNAASGHGAKVRVRRALQSAGRQPDLGRML